MLDAEEPDAGVIMAPARFAVAVQVTASEAKIVTPPVLPPEL